MNSLMPILLLNALRKTLSLLVLAHVVDINSTRSPLNDKADFDMATTLQVSYLAIVD